MTLNPNLAYAVSLPVEHNGQTFILQPLPGYFGHYRVALDTMVVTETALEMDEVLDAVSVEETLGFIYVGQQADEESIEARTRWNTNSNTFLRTLNDALAFVVDTYRPCTHPDGNGTTNTVDGEPVFRCSDCSALFTLSDEGDTTVVEYAHPHA
jgi:hypothetical protein